MIAGKHPKATTQDTSVSDKLLKTEYFPLISHAYTASFAQQPRKAHGLIHAVLGVNWAATYSLYLQYSA